MPHTGMGGRAVEGTGLENRQAGDRLVGSNPTPSASLIRQPSSALRAHRVEHCELIRQRLGQVL